MKLFWKINIYISVITFTMFLTYLISISYNFFSPKLSNYIMSFTVLFFIYGTFLEIIQIPICLLALFSKYKQKRVWLFFLMMTIFFIIKIRFYFYTFLN